MKKGFTPSPKEALRFSQRFEVTGFKEMNGHYFLKQGLSGKAAKRCCASLVRGFTLIELLVVIAVIGILAGVLLVSLGGARSQARDTRIISDLNEIRARAETIYAQTGKYDVLQTANERDTTGGITYASLLDIGKNGGTSTSTLAIGQEYCASSKLNDSSYTYCVDSAGTAKRAVVDGNECETVSTVTKCQ